MWYNAINREKRRINLDNKYIIEEMYRKIYKVSDPVLLKHLVAVSHEWQVPKKSSLIHAGSAPDYLFFLIKGIVRGFFLDREGKDITDCLFSSFGSAIWPSMSLTDAARIDLEAISDCTVLKLSVADIQHLLKQFPEIMLIYNLLLEHSLFYHWELRTMLYQCTAQERYEWFLKKYPGVIDQISHKYIASFLGMNPVTLSRLRNRNKIGSS